MSSPERDVVFFTNSEHGQSNVALAVAGEFLRRGEFRVHVASFSALAPRVQSLNENTDYSSSAIFHTIPGPSLADIVLRDNVDLCHKPGLGAIDGFRKMNTSILAYKPSEYIQNYRKCLEILQELRPDVVVVDPIFHIALDASRVFHAHTVILWPVPVKDVVITIQPNAGIFWKYPMTGSGYPFPIPWTLIPANIFLMFRLILDLGLGKPLRGILRFREEADIQHPFPLTQPYQKDYLHLTPAFPEMDFPLCIPDNVISCGPILRECPSLSKSDPSLNAWLNKPTILISLGSHFQATESSAVEMTIGLWQVFEKYPAMQILWKLRYDWESSAKLRSLLGPLADADTLRVVEWLEPDIISVLNSGHIVAFVHHGGANSFFEACKAGVPQVVLPQWLDTYDCAARVEWLGIGLYGSRSVAPSLNAVEFSETLLTIIQKEETRAKARKIADLCAATEGRVLAHDRIVQYAQRNRHED